MRSLVGVSLPGYDEKTDAVLLYSETDVTVLSVDKIRTHVREAYKIWRPQGRDHGTVPVFFNPTRKIRSLHGWCIPAQGKDYEVKDKDAIDVAPPADGGELVDDVKYRILRIPASDPGNIVGYEYEVEEQPFFLQDNWGFQEPDPVRESHYSLEVPAGWEYRATWLSYPEVKPTEAGGNVSQWVVNDVKAIRSEPDMPPWRGVAGQMIVSFFPAGGTSKKNEFVSWDSMEVGTGICWADGWTPPTRSNSRSRSYRGQDLDPGQDASHRRVCAARHSLRRDRIRHRRISAACRSRSIQSSLWGLQGQSDADAHDAARDRC